ncbi:MAG: hypothetical protein JNL44_03810 [Gemmatimonadetes bacterium]|nr:hypothetical protein [Gemmatimonadota bacterium]
MSIRTILPALVLVASGCASSGLSTGATFRSGVGDAFLEHPPYYAGAMSRTLAQPGTRIGVLPVHYQPGASQPAIFDPRWGPGSPIAALLTEMNAYLDSLATPGSVALVRLADGSRVSAVAPTSMGVPPDVRFGCMTEGDLPGEDCVARGDSALGRKGQRMKLAVGRPSPQWVTWLQESGGANDVTHTLVLTLEVGNYLMKQTGITGRKSVELGTDHTVSLPWLTSLETPVMVLQLTGALVDRDGRAVRIGAEGMLAQRTRLTVSAMRAQEVLGDAQVAELRSARREDMDGAPLVWQVALRNLVAQLTR